MKSCLRIIVITLFVSSFFLVTNMPAIAGWEWHPPSLYKNTLYGIWGSSGTDVFVVGGNYDSVILHYDGTTWSFMDSGTNNSLYGIWGSSDKDVFVVGEAGTILHYDGNNWFPMISGTTNNLRGVWGTSGMDVFVVGDVYCGCIEMEQQCDFDCGNCIDVCIEEYCSDSTILYYDGSTWSPMNSGKSVILKNIWGTSGTDVFAVGNHNCWCEVRTCECICPSYPYCFWHRQCENYICEDDIILHYDGSNWTGMYSDPHIDLRSIWGSSGNNIFVVGVDTENIHNGTILYYDGSTWSEIYSDGYTYFYAVWGSSKTDVFAVGDDGTIFHYDGTSWTQMITGWLNQLHDVWGSSATDVFAVGYTIDKSSQDTTYLTTILHYDGNNWSFIQDVTDELLMGIWGSSATNIYAVGYSVSGTYPDFTYSATILHYDSTTWSEMDSETTNPLYGIWGSSDTDVFAVGEAGTILHYDGNNWSSMISGTTNNLRGVRGTSDTDVFAVGEAGTILHYDGNNWSSMTSGTTNNLRGVWGTSGTNVFVVGYYGNIYSIHHYDGNTWSEMTTGSGYLWDIWGSSETDIFAVGKVGYNYNNYISLHYDGSNWSLVEDEPSVGYSNQWNLYGIWGSSATDVFAVGPNGTILHYDGSDVTTTTTTTTPNTTTSITDDNCPTEEIFGTYSEKTELLRHFRDNVLSQTPEGQELIRLYYEWSPVIVRAMQEDEEFKEEVKEMTDGVLGLIGEETD